jgi:hypothetical protein
VIQAEAVQRALLAEAGGDVYHQQPPGRRRHLVVTVEHVGAEAIHPGRAEQRPAEAQAARGTRGPHVIDVGAQAEARVAAPWRLRSVAHDGGPPTLGAELIDERHQHRLVTQAAGVGRRQDQRAPHSSRGDG